MKHQKECITENLKNISYKYFSKEFSSYKDYVKYLKEKGIAIEVIDNNLFKNRVIKICTNLEQSKKLTEEQRKEFVTTLKYLPAEEIDIWTLDTYDWCNKNHFDYRGLIPMGLANNAIGLNIYE